MTPTGSDRDGSPNDFPNQDPLPDVGSGGNTVDENSARPLRSMIDGPNYAWNFDADRLAGWTMQRLVNRTDVYGRYLRPDQREKGKSNNYTAPNKDDRIEGALSTAIIRQHYLGHDPGDLIGVHAIGRDNRCKWFVIDIDKHGEDDPATLETNFAAANAWRQKLVELGFSPRLIDSNGAGGFHLLTLFSEPVSSDHVYRFGHWVVGDYETHGFSSAPEVFPKQPNVNSSRPYGSWWRLPGRHHTRHHWTKIWIEGQWLEGQSAVDTLLSASGDLPALIPEEARQHSPQEPARSGVAGPASTQVPHGPEHWLGLLDGCDAGGRHDALLQLAGHLLGRRVHPQVVEELCVCWNERCNPPEAEEVVRQTVRDLVRRDSAPRVRNPSALVTTTYTL